jgi:serine/threonine protein kinase
MGSVYRCHHVVTNRLQAAVKVLKIQDSGLLGDKNGWFLREVEALSSLSHPGIVSIRSPGMDRLRGLSYLAMELVEGQTLREKMNTKIPQEEVIRLMAGVAGAMKEAHKHRIFHRDLKPANIMIRLDGSPVIVDFGVALDESVGENIGARIGTPTYMPPESFGGGMAEPERGDVYALGVILYELLMGQRAFQRGEGGARSQLEQIRKQKLLKVILDPGDTVSPPLRQLILRATRPDPDAPGAIGMEEFAEALEQIRGEPISGTLAPRVVRPRRPWIEWLLWLAGAALAAFLLSSVGGGLAWGFLKFIGL